MKLNNILAFILIACNMHVSFAQPCIPDSRMSMSVSDFREALRLYDKDMYSSAAYAFDDLHKSSTAAEPKAYSLLCDVKTNVQGYVGRMEAFFNEHPYSAMIPQIKYYHALNLFASGDYVAAYKVLVELSEKKLYKAQRT